MQVSLFLHEYSQAFTSDCEVLSSQWPYNDMLSVFKGLIRVSLFIEYDLLPWQSQPPCESKESHTNHITKKSSLSEKHIHA